jgi:flagellar assembly factor FliW
LSLTIDSSRFGTLEIDPEEVIEFPHGLIGLEGSRYTLLDRNPGSGFLWLHSLEDPELALPVVDPRRFFPRFALEVAEEERERVGGNDAQQAQIYVTVRAAPNPADVVVNLRAPLVVTEGRGHQVLNTAPGAELQAPLFAAEGQVSAGGHAASVERASAGRQAPAGQQAPATERA